MSKNQPSHFLLLGLAITIMSSSGTLGRYIQLPPPTIIWIRCLIGTIALFATIKFLGRSTSLGNRKTYWVVLASAVLLGGHWVTYFYSLQLSSVAIGMLSLFTYPVITSILEPILLKTKFQRSGILLAFISLAGVGLLAPEFNLENDYTLGIVIGIFSSICYSLRNILLKTQVSSQSGLTLMFYQLLFIALLGWPMLFIEPVGIASVSANWEALLILGILTTATGHTLFVMSFKHFTISTVSIISALTPLIGTLLGFIFLDEIPAGRTFIGGALIFSTVIIESLMTVKRKGRS